MIEAMETVYFFINGIDPIVGFLQVFAITGDTQSGELAIKGQLLFL